MQSDALFLINLASQEYQNGNISGTTFLQVVENETSLKLQSS